MDLSVVAAGLFLKEVVSEPLRLEVARNAEGVRAVSFLNSVCDAGVLREITECVSNLNFGVPRPQPLEERPAHDAHEGFRLKRSAAFHSQLDLAAVECLVARLAERDQIVGSVASRAPALNVMDVENLVLGLSVAVLALVSVSEKDVFTNVPEAELFALLVLDTLNVGILQTLHVKGRRFHDDLRHRQDAQDRLNARDMCADAVLHGRRKPSLISLAVVEPRSTVTGLAGSTGVTQSTATRKKLGNVLTKFDFRRIEFRLFGGGRKSNVLVPGVDAEGHGLRRFSRGDRELNGEGCAPFHHRLLFFEKNPCLG